MDRAGHWFDEHGRFIGEVDGNIDQLARMGNHAVTPAAARVCAEPALQAGGEVTECHPFAAINQALRAPFAQRIDAASHARQDWYQHHPTTDRAVGVHNVGDDFVAWGERVADQRIEVRRSGAVDHRQVAAADTC